LDERFRAKTYESSAKAARDSGLDLYYWIESGGIPKLAAAAPEWMASLGMHTDWLKRFPHAKTPGAGEVAKAFPWGPLTIGSIRRAFARYRSFAQQLPPDYRGILLNDLQGGPASCGCGNLQCRWATDITFRHCMKFEATMPPPDSSRRSSQSRQQGSHSVWAPKCDNEDLPKEKRAGEWTTGYSARLVARRKLPQSVHTTIHGADQGHRGNVESGVASANSAGYFEYGAHRLGRALA